MAKDREFDELLQKYHLALAKAQDLQEQLYTKQDQWDKRNEDFSILEKNVRELCEDILAKDPGEMVLGKDYSWATIEVAELVRKSRRVFRKYNEQRNDLLKKIMDTAEERAAIISGLETQILEIKNNSSNSVVYTKEELEKLQEKEKEEKRKKEEQEKIKNEIDIDTRKAMENGTIDVEMVKNAVGNGTAVATEVDEFGLDDDEPIQSGKKSRAQKIMEKSAKDNTTMQITPKSIPITQTQKSIQQKQKNKEKFDAEYRMTTLNEMWSKINEEYGLMVLDVIGTYGISLRQDIIDKIKELYLEKNPKLKDSFLSNIMTDMANVGILKKEQVNTYYTSLRICTLSSDGAKIYKYKFGKPAVLSECDKIRAEHDNLEHGYSITHLSEIIKDSMAFKEVTCMNRKNPITINGNITYVPDIKCVSESGTVFYIEYDHLNWSQSNLNSKLNKIIAVTHTINFIIPNQKSAQKLKDMIMKWIGKLNDARVRHVKVRIITAKAVTSDLNLMYDASWQYILKPSESMEFKSNY